MYSDPRTESGIKLMRIPPYIPCRITIATINNGESYSLKDETTMALEHLLSQGSGRGSRDGGAFVIGESYSLVLRESRSLACMR